MRKPDPVVGCIDSYIVVDWPCAGHPIIELTLGRVTL
jgi:hypothetical protein